MKCQQAENWMDLALDAGLGEDGQAGAPGLPAGWRPILDAHLVGCSRCRSQWEMLRAAEQALRIPQPVAAPNDLLLEFRRRVEAGPVAQPVVSTPSVRFRWPWLLPIGGLAAVGATAALMVALRAPILPRTENQEMAANRPAAAPAMVEAPAADAEWQKALPAQPARTPAASQFENATPAAPAAPVPAAGAGSQAKGPSATLVPPQGPVVRMAPGVHSPVSPPPTTEQKPGGASLGVPLYSQHTSPSLPPTEQPAAEPQAMGRSARPLSPKPTEVFDVARRGLDRKAGGTSESIRPKGSASPLNAANNAEGEASRWFGQGENADSQVSEGLGQGAKRKVSRRRDLSVALTEEKQSPQPAEPSVSPVLLAALRKPVEPGSEQGTLQQVVQKLAAATGTPVAFDPAVQEANIVLPQKPGPFWLVLQSVAKQANLRVVPRTDLLLLAPATPPVHAESARRRADRSQAAQQQRAMDQYREDSPSNVADAAQKPAPPSATRPNGPSGPLGPAGPGIPPAPPLPSAGVPGAPVSENRLSGFRMSFGAAFTEKPDRRVWRVSEWGNLPTRGFAPIPPVTLKVSPERAKPARKRGSAPSQAPRPRRPQ